MVKRAGSGDGGQASIELVAAVPALVIAVLLVAEFVAVGYSLWSAGVAARAGARAAYVGGDGAQAARASLPPALRKDASVRDGDGLAVRVRTPAALPGLPRIPVTARAGLGVGDASGG
jgi:pilus assembly protein CpaE